MGAPLVPHHQHVLHRVQQPSTTGFDPLESKPKPGVSIGEAKDLTVLGRPDRPAGPEAAQPNVNLGVLTR